MSKTLFSYMYTHSCARVKAHLCQSTRKGQRETLGISSLLPLCSRQAGSHLHCKHQASWPMNLWGFSCHHHSRHAGITDVCYNFQLHVSTGELNSRPHLYMASALPWSHLPSTRDFTFISIGNHERTFSK